MVAKTDTFYTLPFLVAPRQYKKVRDGAILYDSRHVVPGYYQAVPRGQNTSTRRGGLEGEPLRRPGVAPPKIQAGSLYYIVLSPRRP